MRVCTVVSLALLAVMATSMTTTSPSSSSRTWTDASSAPQCVQLLPNLTWAFIPSNDGTACVGSPAYGLYNASRFQIGWDQLYLETDGVYPDTLQAYAAGFFEGAATKEVVIEFYNNMIAPVQFNESVSAFFEANLEWVAKMLFAKNNTGDAVWDQVGLMMTQFDGFLDGLNSQIVDPSQKFTKVMLLFVASQGDLLDLTGKYPVTATAVNWRNLSKHDFELWLGQNSHCSSFVRINEDHSDLIFAHATWQSFTFALRIFKTLTFRYRGVAMQTIQFSSYPATFVSTDDFHMLDSKLVVMETSLNVFNLSTYVHVVPESLLSWVRVMVANRLATSGSSWQNIFSQYNSGTYNNEWLIIDLNLFRPNQPWQQESGILTIVDQMPGLIIGRDLTGYLFPASRHSQGQGYFPSYNVPVFPEIFNYAGYPAAIEQQGGQMLDYNNCVRAQIFRQRCPNVSSVDDAKFLIQYNDYEHDPISQGNPLYAIASRVDLTPSSIGGAQAFGAIDGKVSSYASFLDFQKVHAFSGPTPQQSTFSFSTTTASLSGPHQGVPPTFNFSYNVFQL
ncbi:phospholipase B, putative [Bodo saltans]|uniref:Phospholipase B-like n=1 Tax=Bodo saltans TaxID=75058 RepID=A0A0S4K0A4_BODSA|nr:phospholipase B, putative [Bodo saltans]|eukprot:CUG94263.1 phospholipase B, putative [Bodo saltans]